MKIQRPLTPPVQLQSKARPDDDYGQAVESGISDQAKLSIAAGWVGLTTAAGAAIGHQRGLSDVVTIERIPYPETVQVPVGTREVQGCYRYHPGYDYTQGQYGMVYGYDASCTETVTDYETRLTGNTLYREVEHHSQGFPYSAWSGALLGAGVGVATGVAGLVLNKLLRHQS